MGLNVSIYRSDYDCELNYFYGKKSVTVINAEGPFEPTEDSPAAIIKDGYTPGSKIIVPADEVPNYQVQMSGGTFGFSSDSRFREATGTYSALSIHDRRETHAEYEAFSR